MNMQFISVFFWKTYCMYGIYIYVYIHILQIAAMLLSIHEYFKYLRKWPPHGLRANNDTRTLRWLREKTSYKMGLYIILDSKLVNYRFYHSCWYFVYHIPLKNKVNKERDLSLQRETLTRFPVAVLLQHFNLGNLAFVNRASGQVVDAQQKTSTFLVVLIGRVIQLYIIFFMIYIYMLYVFYNTNIHISLYEVVFEMYIIYDIWYKTYIGFFWYVIYMKYAICI